MVGELNTIVIALFLIFNLWYWLWKGLEHLWNMEKFKVPWRTPTNPLVASLAFIVGGIGFTIGVWGQSWFNNAYWAFAADLAPELIGLAFTVFVIDELVERAAAQRYKEQTIEQLNSPVRDIAVEALRLVRKEDEWWDEVICQDRLQYVHFEGANLRYANLEGANLTEAHLEGAKLRGANLQRANLYDANLEGASLGEANLQGAQLKKATPQRARLGDANLEGANLIGANLENANLMNANLQGANFLGANLVDVNLENACLIGTNFEKAIFWGKDFEGNNLPTQHISLKGAKHNQFTKWPSGFDPKFLGAVLVEWDEESEEWIPVEGE